jgi:hypothetical protein
MTRKAGRGWLCRYGGAATLPAGRDHLDCEARHGNLWHLTLVCPDPRMVSGWWRVRILEPEMHRLAIPVGALAIRDRRFRFPRAVHRGNRAPHLADPFGRWLGGFDSSHRGPMFSVRLMMALVIVARRSSICTAKFPSGAELHDQPEARVNFGGGRRPLGSDDFAASLRPANQQRASPYIFEAGLGIVSRQSPVRAARWRRFGKRRWWLKTPMRARWNKHGASRDAVAGRFGRLERGRPGVAQRVAATTGRGRARLVSSARDRWLQPVARRHEMTVAYAALHQTLRYKGEDTRLHVLAFTDRTMFFASQRPKLYDAMAKPIAPKEVPPGSYVNVSYHVARGVNRMEAVQIVRQPEEESPFDPLLDDGHL